MKGKGSCRHGGRLPAAVIDGQLELMVKTRCVEQSNRELNTEQQSTLAMDIDKLFKVSRTDQV